MAKYRNCVCGRVRCDSINRERWAVRRSKPIITEMPNEGGVVSIENGDVWWVDKGGTRLCSELPENNSFLVSILSSIRRFSSKVFKPSKTKNVPEVVQFTLSDEEFMEYPFVHDNPRFGISNEHCIGGARRTCAQSVCGH